MITLPWLETITLFITTKSLTFFIQLKLCFHIFRRKCNTNFNTARNSTSNNSFQASSTASCRCGCIIFHPWTTDEWINNAIGISFVHCFRGNRWTIRWELMKGTCMEIMFAMIRRRKSGERDLNVVVVFRIYLSINFINSELWLSEQELSVTCIINSDNVNNVRLKTHAVFWSSNFAQYTDNDISRSQINATKEVK